MRKKLQLIENKLNSREQWEIENGCVEYKLSLDNRDNIRFVVGCDDDIFENSTIEIEPTILGDEESIIKSIINFLYENEINYRNNYIRKTKSFNNRKIKSMTLWLSRGNTDRVQKINEELAERYKTTKKIENEIEEYKDYIRDLYGCLSTLCPDYRIQDIKDYCIERSKHLNMQGVEISILDNKIIAIYNKYKISVDVDSFSRNDNVFRELFSKIKTVQELEEVAC